MDFEKAHDSGDILIEFGIPMKLVKLIRMCLNETYSKDHLSDNLYGEFPI
jgi:hypothetical protein